MLAAKKGLARADFSVILGPMLGAIAFWVSHLIPIRNQTGPVV